VTKCNTTIFQFVYGFRADPSGRLLARVAGSNPAGGVDVCQLLSVVCYQVEFSALVQRGHTECGVSECDHEVSTVRRPWSIRVVAP
jgi:hypothetical protein